MGSSFYEWELGGLQKDKAKLRKDLARHEGDAAKARAALIARLKLAAGSSKSASKLIEPAD